ncbi:glycosyltransferase family 4 protein [Halolamina salifodinae]|uniref:Glycosyltransferase involved in cell wall biosynthesis n=1 Tax=Halolamina salifodinae TaxID=1202767 RepID=A0A8T4GW89_9EURY|nr:glycosyltransferase family 4 protein [Halolamina salifodinae]MBP1985605.1 glycosyltransferase involved in cell wall biosynthesis [Halolamina salifodinae]
MKALIAPYFEGNNYLEILQSELEERDIEVIRENRAYPLWPIFLQVVKNDIDVLHLHWTHPYFIFGDHSRFKNSPIKGLLSAISAGIFVIHVFLCSLICSKIVWTVHNRVNHECVYENIDLWVSHQLVSIVDTIQIWDDQTKHELEDFLDVEINDAVTIPHGNYDPVYSETEQSKPEARDQLSHPHEERMILYFGRIRPYKQVSDLISAWKDIETEDSRLVIAGNSKDPDLTDEIRSMVENTDNISLDLRYIPDEEVPTYFAACDICVFPYEKIFNSGSVLLAMTFSRPFIAPQMGSIPGVDPGGNLLYEPNKQGLRNALSEAVSVDDQTLESIGKENRTAAETKYDWDSIADDLIEAYHGELNAE